MKPNPSLQLKRSLISSVYIYIYIYIYKTFISDQHCKFLNRERSGRLNALEENVAQIRQTISDSPTLSMRHASQLFGIPYEMICQNLHKRLNFYPYKVLMQQALYKGNKICHLNFADEMLDCIDAIATFSRNIIFTDEAMFYAS